MPRKDTGYFTKIFFHACKRVMTREMAKDFCTYSKSRESLITNFSYAYRVQEGVLRRVKKNSIFTPIIKHLCQSRREYI